MRCALLGFALGIVGLQQREALLSMREGATLAAIFAIAAIAVVALVVVPAISRLTRVRHWGNTWVRTGLIVVLGMVAGLEWGDWRARCRLAVELPIEFEGRDIEVVGQVASLPLVGVDATRFEFWIEQGLLRRAGMPRRVLLNLRTQDKHLPIRPGECWRFVVRLKRPHRPVNFGASDGEGQWLERDIRATGYVRDHPAPVRNDTTRCRADSDPDLDFAHLGRQVRIRIEALRFAIRERMLETLRGAGHAGVLIALAIGDQSALTNADEQRFIRTGTRHLIAVSGLHIALIAGALAGLASLAWRRLPWLRTRAPLAWPAPHMAAVCGALAACAYAALAGFGVPALRAFVMFASAALATLVSRSGAPSVWLAWALGIVVLVDPWAVLSAGFWLSFGAVAAMMLGAAAAPGGAQPAWRQALRAQWAVTIALVPLTLAFFAQVPLLSPVANALAIPWASYVVTPLTLIGVVSPAPLDAWIWRLAHIALTPMMRGADWLAAPGWAVLQLRAPGAVTLMLGVAGALWSLMPRGWPLRGMAWLLWLPLALPAGRPAEGEFRVTVFDVGQGAAALIETRTRSLVFDTGPRYGTDRDAGQAIVVPALAINGIDTLDMLVVSHADADHAGGAASIGAAVAVGALRASLDAGDGRWHLSADARRCRAGDTWRWDGVRFTMLWPTAQASGTRNAASCVMRVEGAQWAVLFAADIEAEQERALVAAHGPALGADVLIAPHHGSRTSSTEAFLDSVAPREVVFQVGYRNRFGHPHAAIAARYAARGVHEHRTDRDGAIRISSKDGRIEIERCRSVRHRYWMGR